MTTCKGRRLCSIAGTLVVALLGLGLRDAALGACNPAICVGANPCTISGVNTIDNGCSLDWGPNRDVVVAGTLTTAKIGDSYTLAAGTLTVNGTLQARGGTLAVRTARHFIVQVVNNSAAKIDVERDGTLDVVANGAALLHGKDISGDGTTTTFTGFISVAAAAIDITSPIHANGTGGNDGGVVLLFSTSSVVVDGAMTANGGGTLANGGTVGVDSGGDIWVKKPVTANSDDGGFAGDIAFATDNNARIDGDITARGIGTQAMGGTIDLSAGSTTITGAWKTIGTGGGGGDIDIESDGSTILTSTSSFSTAAAAAGDGGGILVSGGDVTVAGSITTNTTGQLSSSGLISIEADHNLTLSSSIEGRTSSGGLSNSLVELSACNLTITPTGSVKTRNPMIGGGQSFIYYGASFTAAAGSSVMADDPGDTGGNLVFCRCVDTSPADGVCDTDPPTCASAPTIAGGSITPAIAVMPIALPACS